jgi:hypothetical protein
MTASSTLLRRLARGLRTAAWVKGFGCRPVVTYRRALRAGVRKPPRKEPGGAAWAVVVYGDSTGRRFG